MENKIKRAERWYIYQLHVPTRTYFSYIVIEIFVSVSFQAYTNICDVCMSLCNHVNGLEWKHSSSGEQTEAIEGRVREEKSRGGWNLCWSVILPWPWWYNDWNLRLWQHPLSTFITGQRLALLPLQVQHPKEPPPPADSTNDPNPATRANYTIALNSHEFLCTIIDLNNFFGPNDI